MNSGSWISTPIRGRRFFARPGRSVSDVIHQLDGTLNRGERPLVRRFLREPHESGADEALQLRVSFGRELNAYATDRIHQQRLFGTARRAARVPPNRLPSSAGLPAISVDA